jgi:DNA-binding FrmR family transcriptional regulator
MELLGGRCARHRLFGRARGGARPRARRQADQPAASPAGVGALTLARLGRARQVRRLPMTATGHGGGGTAQQRPVQGESRHQCPRPGCKDEYLKRLRRIEGQIRGRQKMVEDDKYRIDILTQVSAATRALQAVALGLLEDHLGHCVTQAVAEGSEAAEAKVREASDAIARLVKS